MFSDKSTKSDTQVNARYWGHCNFHPILYRPHSLSVFISMLTNLLLNSCRILNQHINLQSKQLSTCILMYIHSYNTYNNSYFIMHIKFQTIHVNNFMNTLLHMHTELYIQVQPSCIYTAPHIPFYTCMIPAHSRLGMLREGLSSLVHTDHHLFLSIPS